MEVSRNEGSPRSSILIGFSMIFHEISQPAIGDPPLHGKTSISLEVSKPRQTSEVPQIVTVDLTLIFDVKEHAGNPW